MIRGKSRLSPWKTQQDGYVWSAAARQRTSVRLTLPPAAKLEEVPDDWSQSIPGASCRLTYRREGNDILFDSEITQAGGFLSRANYEALRQFLQKVYDVERRPVLVRRSVAQ